jgi:hypothetical protein
MEPQYHRLTKAISLEGSLLITLPALHDYKNVFNRRMSMETKRIALSSVVMLLLCGWCTFGATVEATDPFLPQIVEPFKDPSNSVREAAARAAYLPQIVELFKDPNDSVRAAAVRAVGTMGEAAKPYLPQIVKMLHSDQLGVQKVAAEALGNLGPIAAPYAGDIAEMLRSTDPDDRRIAAEALGKLGPAAAPYAEILVPITDRLFITKEFLQDISLIASILGVASIGVGLAAFCGMKSASRGNSGKRRATLKQTPDTGIT